jgi:NADH:ubiquinone oxidoreductase subunit 3 (subunit A)
MDLNILLSPPVAFLVLFGVSALLYLLGRWIGAKPNPEPGKAETYACGENYHPDKFTFGYRHFFIAAIFFTIMHVAVLTIATVPGGALAYRALGYLAVIAISVSVLFVDFD